ncbi:HDIG domain-containing metalloprotein [Dethiobacter alkaliphilus]|uniref:Metal dependent phosphohydrolase n=1 Tax=Dethiobacter alkaliphilus AHT 1 TaxID=555088 RepID=C0GFB9_DETAL|nr:HDIG domain-containing metalloprotein [Dethiobacter alkaliphilus]EEG77879.1 metal dependent phosphohydrolase [Dethiobacter alkaliphilus AHT 1]
MERTEALTLVKKHVKNKNLIKHMIATEAVMGALARHFGKDETTWRLAGLIHDLDYDKTCDSPEQHGLLTVQMLQEMDFPQEIIQAVRAHNEALGFPRESEMDKALYAADPVTGLIVAAALIHPDKKLASIDAQFVLNRFGEKQFARGANREQIQACSELGMDLEQFITLSLEAMQQNAKELGL